MLSDKDFNDLAKEKGELAGIINEFCKENGGAWLVNKEDIFNILVEVRFLDGLEKYELANKIFGYADSTALPGRHYAASKRVYRAGKDNSILRIFVKWSKKGAI